MKSTRYLLATLALCGAPLLAAPAKPAPVTAPVVEPAPPIAPMDARAISLLDQSAKAYEALTELSQKFVITDTVGGAVQPGGSGTGTLQIQSPDKARMEVKMGDAQMIFVGNKTTFISQDKPNLYEKNDVDNPIIAVVVSMPSAAPLLLNDLSSGKNPLTAKDGTAWENVKVVSLDGMSGVSMQLPTQPGRNPVVFQVFLDPKTNLVARVEAATSIVKKTGEAAVPYSNLTTFTTDSSAIVPADFQYTPPVGAKLMTEADRPKTYDPRLIVGAEPFALTGKTLEGKTLSLDSYKGKVVLLDFWATWCGPCVGELPNVQANYQTYHPKGFDIVAVSLDEDKDALTSFIKEKALPWPQIFDGKGWEAGDAKAYGVQAIPFSLLIGKDGKIAAVNPRGEELEPAIKAAMAK